MTSVGNKAGEELCPLYNWFTLQGFPALFFLFISRHEVQHFTPQSLR